MLDKNGLRLIHITTWLKDFKRWRLGIAQSGGWANTWWISPDLGELAKKVQQLFDGEGKRLTYVTTYKEGSERRWIGIAQSADWAHRWYMRQDLDSFQLEVQQLLEHENVEVGAG
jgi:hypothetical protein